MNTHLEYQIYQSKNKAVEMGHIFKESYGHIHFAYSDSLITQINNVRDKTVKWVFKNRPQKKKGLSSNVRYFRVTLGFDERASTTTFK